TGGVNIYLMLDASSSMGDMSLEEDYNYVTKGTSSCSGVSTTRIIKKFSEYSTSSSGRVRIYFKAETGGAYKLTAGNGTNSSSRFQYVGLGNGDYDVTDVSGNGYTQAYGYYRFQETLEEIISNTRTIKEFSEYSTSSSGRVRIYFKAETGGAYKLTAGNGTNSSSRFQYVGLGNGDYDVTDVSGNGYTQAYGYYRFQKNHVESEKCIKVGNGINTCPNTTSGWNTTYGNKSINANGLKVGNYYYAKPNER